MRLCALLLLALITSDYAPLYSSSSPSLNDQRVPAVILTGVLTSALGLHLIKKAYEKIIEGDGYKDIDTLDIPYDKWVKVFNAERHRNHVIISAMVLCMIGGFTIVAGPEMLSKL